MFSIVSKDRRVTNYVKSQAYKWLYAKITSNEYTAHNSDSENVLLNIKRAGCVNEQSYREFTEKFLNGIYYYINRADKPKNLTNITTNKVDNYFLPYNNVLLPVGFVKEFFEDDYETQEQISEYYKTFLDGYLDDFIISCQTKKNICMDNIETLKESQPAVFQTKFSFHLTNNFKIVLTLFGLILNLSFIFGNDVIGNITDLFNNGTNAFVEANLGSIIANIFFFIYLLPKVVNIVKIIIFYVRLLYVRIYVGKVQKSLEVFNTDTVEEFKEHFGNINKILIKQKTPVLEGECLQAPKSRKQYLAVMDFKVKDIKDKLDNLKNKFDKVVFYSYKTDGSDLKTRAKLWRKGIFFLLLVCVAFVFVNIPAANEWFMSLIESAQ